MPDAPEIRPAKISRRSMGRGFVWLGAGYTIFTATLGFRAFAAPVKAPQKSVAYQDTPKGAFRCDNCAQFVEPAACKVVDGVIAPAGWCRMYIKKPA